MEILNQFGVQPILLLAQIVNFLVLLFILKRFLYKPILKVLAERKQKIAQSLKDAEKIEKQLLKTEEEKEKVLAEAAGEAKKIIEEASKSAEQLVSEAHLKAAQDMEVILQKGQETISLEREKMQQEMKSELADIVTVALEKVAGKVLTKKDQKELLQRSIKDL